MAVGLWGGTLLDMPLGAQFARILQVELLLTVILLGEPAVRRVNIAMAEG